ncbi:MAG: Bax inhibitor-1 family protein [Candidatus Peribacteraceae bacterium]
MFQPSMPISQVSSPVILRRWVAQAYWLMTFAMVMTLVGVFAGMTFAMPIIASGWIFAFFLAEVVLVFSARAWVRSPPLNYVLFALFPFLSGLTLTPILIGVLTGYVNGASILLNAVVSSALLVAASAVVANIASANLGGISGRFLFNALIGLLVFGLLQLFIPAMRGPAIEMIVSGAGIIVFALFLAYDIQRLQRDASLGESPFLLALSLYLDIFNLFLYVLRFMMALSGQRR